MRSPPKTRGNRRSELQRRAVAGRSRSAATIEMVAQEAGVSPSTVSRMLNGTARVRDAKMRAVEAAIAKLNFMPNPVARSLARGKSMSIGVVTQSIESPFYGEALAAIERGLMRDRYSALIVSGHWREGDERQSVAHLLGRRVDGIILLTSCLPDHELVDLSQRVPLVVTGRSVQGERIFCLDADSTEGARLATHYLIGQGHRRIAFLSGPPDHPDALQRLDGYKAALAASKIAFSRRLVAYGDYSEPGGHRAMDELLDSRVEFTAAFAANDQMAYGAMLAMYRRGVTVPRDVSMVGFDDLAASAFSIPPLTTVHRSIVEVGEDAAEAIIDMIEGRPPRARLSSPKLAIRESTRPLRG